MFTAYRIHEPVIGCQKKDMGINKLRAFFAPTTAGLVEWPTLTVLAATYVLWAVGTTWLATISLPIAVALTAVAIAQYSSLQHEAIHGHPFRNKTLNAALVFPALTLILPYARFRDTHLDHHLDSRLTDPYDDPESNYVDAGEWDRMTAVRQKILDFNNTLAGRLAIGPVIGTAAFLKSDWDQRYTDPRVIRGWVLHLPALAIALVWLTLIADMPFWAYVISAYLGLSILRIRTFLEHQAHEKARGRTVIIDDRGPLALLFLNNNYHVLHHIHPRVPWYQLPKLFRKNPERYLSQNDGYFFKSYAEIFARYFFRKKDPVPHPLWRRG